MALLKYILIVFFGIVTYLSNGQNDFYFEALTINNGLPHQTVYQIVQDRKGFIWLGTQGGLVRYDGYTFKLMALDFEANKSGLYGKAVHALLKDKKGNLWIGTHSGGLYKQDIQTGEFENLTDKAIFKILLDKRIQSLFEDASGNIWIGTLDDGVFIYNPVSQKVQHFNTQNSQLSNPAVFAFAQDKSGRVWVATTGEGLNYFDSATNKFKQVYTDSPNFNGYQKSLLIDDKNNLWIGSDGTGLYQMDLGTNTFKHYDTQTPNSHLTSNAVMSLALDKNKNILVATDGGGLNIIDPNTHTFKSYKSDNSIFGSLNTNALYHVCVDKDDNIWLATFNGGVNIHKAHQIRFEHFLYSSNYSKNLSSRSVLSLCQTTDGSIWVGTDGSGLNLFDKSNKRFLNIPQPHTVQDNVVKTMFEDSKKRLWLGYFNGGLALYNRNQGVFKHYLYNPLDSFSLSHNSVWSIAEEASGRLWVGTVGKGVNLFDPQSGKCQHFYHNPLDTMSLSHDGIMVVMVDKKDNVWIGTEHSGLNMYNRKENNFTRFQYNKYDPLSISSNHIRAIFEDKRGRLWIATEGGGLNLWLGDNKFKHFTIKEGLISDAVMAITEDKNGFLWLSALEGVSRFDSDKGIFQNFRFNKKIDGLVNQFNQAAILRANDGEILFGGINGLNIIQPEIVVPNHVNAPIVFTDFRVMGVSATTGKLPDGHRIFEGDINDLRQIQLSYHHNAFTFEFAALDFTEPLYNQYAFKMEGFDQDWSFVSAEQRVASYTNLPPGTYTFKVRATNSSGEWSKTEAQIEIVITPPFWRTNWFQFLATLTLLSLGIFVFRFYVRQREILLHQRILESEQEVLNLKNAHLESEQLILNLQNDKLATEIETKNNELVSKAIQIAHKNELLVSIKDSIENIKTAEDSERQKQIRSLIRLLESEIENKANWEQFISYFDQANHKFVTELQAKHPQLTSNDLRMCALTRLNMSNKEMATALNITIKAVEKSRYRLKKRLNLTPDDDLTQYLMSI